MLDSASQSRLVQALANSDAFDRSRGPIRVIETHISYVLLTGAYAYKIKKAVDFGFLNFTTLAARRHFCEEEVRLNRRLAPEVYVDVVAIAGTPEAPEIAGEGVALEYAVRMREFPQEALAGALLARGELDGTDIDGLAAQIAAFHASLGTGPPDTPFGEPGRILEAARENLARIGSLATTSDDRGEIDALAAWTEREYLSRRGMFRGRQQSGFIRECHGDLHLGNMARIGERLVVFDCIEFNDSMRWIDVMSEVAFTVMDLEDRKRPDLARRFLNAYVEITGDYAGLGVLRFYLVYRALVRAKIHRLRAAQFEGGESRTGALAEYRGYLHLARIYTRVPHPAIVLTHGLSGCGKTVVSQMLLEATGAVRIRTDLERKRLRGLSPRVRAGSTIESGLYAPEVTDATYRKARALAREVVCGGFIAIVDGTFLRRWQRELFRSLALELRLSLLIVAFTARESTLRERLIRRAAEGIDASDAGLAVLAHQLRTQEPLAPEEYANVVEYDAERPLARTRDAQAWRDLLAGIDGRVRG